MFENNDIEDVIISYLFYDRVYFNKVFGSLKKDLFGDVNNLRIYNELSDFVKEYDKTPSLRDLALKIKNNPKYKDDEKKELLTKMSSFQKTEKTDNVDFILDETQKYIKKTQLSQAIMDSVDLIKEGKDLDPVIEKVQDSLNVNFDVDPGLDYLNSIGERIDYYKQRLSGIPTGIKTIDKMINGGFIDKTLNVFLSASGGGKSAIMVSIGANMLLKGKNILYITLEMAEKEIAKRFDSNILDISSNELKTTNDSAIQKRFDEIKDNLGKLYIKEYAAGSFNALQLKSLVEEIHNTKGVLFDVIIIDYLTLMASYRTTLGKAGSYGLYKSVAEELHGFSKICPSNNGTGIPIITACQLNRSAINNIEADQSAISDSLGILMTADNVMGILHNENLRERNECIIKIMKNRNAGILKDVILKTDFQHMRFMDFEETNNNDVLGELREKPKTEENFGSFKF